MSSDLERLLLGFSRHAQKSMGNLNNIQEQQIAFFQPPQTWLILQATYVLIFSKILKS